MSDPNLNSIHLAGPRREDFRRARQVLLQSRGPATQRLEAEEVRSLLGQGTLADAPGQRASDRPAKFALVEHDRTYPLKIGVNTVGRLADNDVVIPDPHVSRRHFAILVHANDTCEVHDTASKNGTYVNGQRITCPTRLKPGDEIRMCDHHLVLVSLEDATYAETPRPSDPPA